MLFFSSVLLLHSADCLTFKGFLLLCYLHPSPLHATCSFCLKYNSSLHLCAVFFKTFSTKRCQLQFRVSVCVCLIRVCVSIWVCTCICVYFYMYIVAFRLFLPFFLFYLITVMLHTSCVFLPLSPREIPNKTHANQYQSAPPFRRSKS